MVMSAAKLLLNVRCTIPPKSNNDEKIVLLRILYFPQIYGINIILNIHESRVTKRVQLCFCFYNRYYYYDYIRKLLNKTH